MLEHELEDEAEQLAQTVGEKEAGTLATAPDSAATAASQVNPEEYSLDPTKSLFWHIRLERVAADMLVNSAQSTTKVTKEPANFISISIHARSCESVRVLDIFPITDIRPVYNINRLQRKRNFAVFF